MLPRLRFVIAAVVIAILPMVFVGTGFVTSGHNNSVAEFPRTNQAVALGTPESRESRQFQALAFARRAGELNRLRDMASAPLSNWVTEPAGADHDRQPTAAPSCVMPDWQVGAGMLIGTADIVPEQFTMIAHVTTESGERAPEAGAPLRTQIAALPGVEPKSHATTLDTGQQIGVPVPQARPKAQVRTKLTQRRRARPLVRARPRPQYPSATQPDFGPFGWLFGIGSDAKISAVLGQQRTF
jgi:hypothetical protein